MTLKSTQPRVSTQNLSAHSVARSSPLCRWSDSMKAGFCRIFRQDFLWCQSANAPEISVAAAMARDFKTQHVGMPLQVKHPGYAALDRALCLPGRERRRALLEIALRLDWRRVSAR